MTFRGRLTLAAAGAVAASVIAASFVAYAIARGELVRQLDRSLLSRAASLRSIQIEQTPSGLELLPKPALGAPGGITQLVYHTGLVVRAGGAEPIPAGDRAQAVAAGEQPIFYSTERVGSTRVRVVTMPYAPGVALQVARPMDETDAVLGRMRWLLLLVVFGGVATAAGIGELVSRAALAPVDRLTRAAERVAATRDPRTRIATDGDDELSRLGSAFNTMLGALDESLRAQRQLVADASHELRTPLTSLRTNIEVLARADALDAVDRERLLHDVLTQIDDLTTLVGDLVDLARGDEVLPAAEEVQLDRLVEHAVDQARTHWPRVRFHVETSPSIVTGVGSRIQRAVANLLDNAAKFSPDEESVEVRVAEGTVTVRDHGPGIDEDDLPHIFDRFYRAPRARALPGSGLGLAIARQVAQSHGGTLTAANVDGGGSEFTLTLGNDDGQS